MASQRQFVVRLEDNRLAAELFGEYDANLALLEERLGIEAVAHGNVVTLRGAEAACALAREVLEGLYGRLETGETIGPGDIDGAIRHATAAPVQDDGAGQKQKNKMEKIRTRKQLVTARSPLQSAYLAAMKSKDIVFSTGPAGTGKTYLAAAMGVAMMLEGKVDRIILSRPAVEAGERLGFLPGDLREKVDPYLRPLYDALYDTMVGEQVMKKLESGEIEVAPLAFMRGRTLSNAFVILDEAQNATSTQMKMFLTRLGENSRMVVTGDPSQVDLPKGVSSGLIEAERILGKVKGVGTVRFSDVDVVRHPLVTRIVRAYNKAEGGAPGSSGRD